MSKDKVKENWMKQVKQLAEPVKFLCPFGETITDTDTPITVGSTECFICKFCHGIIHDSVYCSKTKEAVKDGKI